jgi:hypothetical protein
MMMNNFLIFYSKQANILTKPGHKPGFFALRIVADTGPWLMPVQYERIAWAEGNARINFINCITARATPSR